MSPHRHQHQRLPCVVYSRLLLLTIMTSVRGMTSAISLSSFDCDCMIIYTQLLVCVSWSSLTHSLSYALIELLVAVMCCQGCSTSGSSWRKGAVRKVCFVLFSYPSQHCPYRPSDQCSCNIWCHTKSCNAGELGSTATWYNSTSHLSYWTEPGTAAYTS